MNLDGSSAPRRPRSVLDDLAELYPDGIPEPRRHDGSSASGNGSTTRRIRPPPSGSRLERLVHHLATFWARARPAERRALPLRRPEGDLEGQMRRLAERLDIAVPEDRWPELVDAATFERMRACADRIAPDTTHAIWQDNHQFFHRARAASGASCSTTTVCAVTTPELPSWPSPTSPVGCTANRSRCIDRPADLRARSLGRPRRRLDRAHPLRSAVRAPEQTSFLELVPEAGRLTIEVGCGEGRVARELLALGHRVVGFDASPALLGPPPLTGSACRSPSPNCRAADRNGRPPHRRVLHGAHGYRRPRRRGSGARACSAPGGTLALGSCHPIMTERAFVPGDEYRTFYMGEYLKTMRHVLDVERRAGGVFHFRVGAPADRAVLPRVRSRGSGRRRVLAAVGVRACGRAPRVREPGTGPELLAPAR